MVWFALATPAVAQPAPDDAEEEIIVYADDFARWDDTRWFVMAELMLPLGVPFAAEQNLSFVSYAFQLRAVVACEKDLQLSKNKWEVSCTIEDVGLLASSHRRYRKERDREIVQQVLDEVDGKLTGLDVQMQVDQRGGVTNFDLEGITADNLRERQIQESLRQVLSRVMAGFHLRIPDHAQRSGQWVEYNSELLDMPSLTSSRGSTTLLHEVSPYKGNQLVQTVGQGSVAVNLPAPPDDPRPDFALDSMADTVTVGEGGFGGPGSVGGGAEVADDAEALLSSGGNESDVEIVYSMSATGVALFDKQTGIMTERVWACHGTPTAGAGVISGSPFRNVGRIQLIGKEDRPDVGPTKQVAAPTKVVEGLAPWVDIEAFPR